MKIKKISALILACVMLLSLAACGSGSKLSATLDVIREDGGLKTYYLKNQEVFMRVAQNDILMSEADAQDVLQNPDSWQFYALNVELENNAEEAYTFIGFEAENAQADGFYFSTCPVNAELSLPGSLEEAELYPATVVVNTEKVDTVRLYELVSALEIKVLCYPTPEDDNEEIPEKDYIHLAVENNIEAPEADDTAAEKEIGAKRSSIDDGSSLLELYRSNDIAFSNQAQTLYGMDSETAAKVLAQNGGWECYILYIEVENKADEDITVYSINTENNGENGVWVNSVSQYGEFGLAPDGKDEMPVEILVDTNALGGKSVEQAIAEKSLELVYSKGAMMDAEGNETVNLKKTVEVK